MATERRHRERGFVFVAAAILLVAIVAVVAIAVEVSRLTHTATEVQVAADAGALGAAVAYAKSANEGQSIQVGRNVASLNFANGAQVPIEGVSIAPGNYDPTRAVGDKFHQGDTPHNAFKATVTLTNVEYLTSTLISSQASTPVQKTAVAAPDCPSNGVANFPMTICDTYLTERQPGDQCSDQPRISQVVPTGGQAACWTSLGTGSASSSTFAGLLPQACGGNGGKDVAIGDLIELQNGAVNSFLQTVQCCVLCKDQHKFTIPVVPCSDITGSNGCNGQSAPVIGLATINIATYQDVLLTGGGTNNCSNIYPGCSGPSGDGKINNVNSPQSGLYVNQTCETTTGGHGGGRCFGESTIILGQF
jgi:Flp pilus assembly protein TadG